MVCQGRNLIWIVYGTCNLSSVFWIITVFFWRLWSISQGTMSLMSREPEQHDPYFIFTHVNIGCYHSTKLFCSLLAKIFNFGKYVRLTVCPSVCYLPKFLWNFASMFVWRFVTCQNFQFWQVCSSDGLSVCLFVCPHGPCGHDTGRIVWPIITKLDTNMDPWSGQKPIVFLGQRSNN